MAVQRRMDSEVDLQALAFGLKEGELVRVSVASGLRRHGLSKKLVSRAIKLAFRAVLYPHELMSRG